MVTLRGLVAFVCVLLSPVLVGVGIKHGWRGVGLLSAALVIEFALLVAIGWWRERRARMAPPFRWVRPLRHEPLTVTLASGEHLVFDGVDVEGVGPEADAVLEDWRLARPSRLPPPLDNAARARWARLGLGLKGKSLGRWLSGLEELEGASRDRGEPVEEFVRDPELALTSLHRQALWWQVLGQAPTPEAIGELLDAGVRGSEDAWCWRQALGHRPQPEEIRTMLAAGWPSGTEAWSWAEVFGRLPEREEFAHLERGGIEGWQARQWGEATGTVLPDVDAVAALLEDGVASSFEAVTWSRALGAPLVPGALRPWQEAGVRGGLDAHSWRWALGAGVTPVGVRQLRDVGVQDGTDACRWREALGEPPTPARVSDLVSRGFRNSEDAQRRLQGSRTAR